ncbi:DUF7010 family protein [Arthrobacter antibioticus]|uniref:DUF7010 family protein n=1 Tax=Arthrobacter sp. H35-MC1 TaxID=3046203 RepID=UPI0024B9035F|nr:hypothetical protein [Arthrobacter sp. H35-MC1]MDJ0315800.1 hypothetical protein [Arthrobacter sp. H35-MC1]
MRIPFISKVLNQEELGVEDARLRFIEVTKGGSAFLLAGAAFWLVGALVSLVAPTIRVEYVLYAGFAVPVIGVLIAKLQGARLWSHPGYASLVGFAAITELAALPTMFYLRIEHPEALPGVLLIADGAHLLILMWLHMDYTYFIAGFAKAVLGSLFLFGVLWEGFYPPQMLIGGVISLAAAVFVWRDSNRTLKFYLRPDSNQHAQ